MVLAHLRATSAREHPDARSDHLRPGSTGGDDLVIASSVIDLGRATGLTVVAEGVELPEQLAALHHLGCPAGQGRPWHKAAAASALAGVFETMRRAQPPAMRSAPPPAPGPGRPVRAERGLDRLVAQQLEGASLANVAAVGPVAQVIAHATLEAKDSAGDNRGVDEVVPRSG